MTDAVSLVRCTLEPLLALGCSQPPLMSLVVSSVLRCRCCRW